MKTIASIFGESVAATCVIVICLSIPSLFDFPIWTLPLFCVLAMFYLDWRLGERTWTPWKIVRWVVGMGLLMCLWRWVGHPDYWWLLWVALIIFPPQSWLFWRKIKCEDSHPAA